MTTSDDERGKALALLEATHAFPTVYHLSVIALNEGEVLMGIKAAIEIGLGDVDTIEPYESVPSSAGKYSSHRFRVPCARAEDVLDLYARLKGVTGVMTIL